MYLSGIGFLYCIEGDPGKFRVPDGFVVLGIKPGHRDSYLLWLEGRPPNVVFETTSKSTRSIDETIKPEIYRKIGVAEYFLFDPTADYLNPPLQGFRLTPRGYVPIEPNRKGQLECEQLGLWLETGGVDLLFSDQRTGLFLETCCETAESRAQEFRLAKQAAKFGATQLRREAELKRLAKEAAARREEEERIAKEAAEQRERAEQLLN